MQGSSNGEQQACGHHHHQCLCIRLPPECQLLNGSRQLLGYISMPQLCQFLTCCFTKLIVQRQYILPELHEGGYAGFRATTPLPS